MWCGPAVKLPYCPQIGHKAWRLEKEYGHGHLVDWGIHLIDATRWILGESMPNSVTASGGIFYHKNKITTPDILNVHFEFDSCPVAWRHRIWGATEYDPSVKNGILFYGEKATVFATDRKWIVVPKEKGKDRQIHDILMIQSIATLIGRWQPDFGRKHLRHYRYPRAPYNPGGRPV